MYNHRGMITHSNTRMLTCRESEITHGHPWL